MHRPGLPPSGSQPSAATPRESRLHYAMGVLAWLEGDLSLAREELGIALLFDQDSAYLHMVLGRLAAAQRDLEGAHASLCVALALNPTSQEALFTMGQVLQDLKQPQAALDHFRLALAQGAHHPSFEALTSWYVQQGEGSAAAQVLADWDAAQEPVTQVLLRRGSLRLELGDAQGAQRDIGLYLQRERAQGGPLDLYLHATRACRRYRSALDLLELLSHLEPGNDDLLLHLGALAEEADYALLAVRTWHALDVLQGGHDADAKFLLAQAQLSSGAHEDALVSLRAARALDADLPGLAMAEAHALRALGRAAEALQALEDIQRDAPGGVAYVALRSSLLTELGRHAEARAELRKGLESPSPSTGLARKLALLMAEAGDLLGALELASAHRRPDAHPESWEVTQARLQAAAGGLPAALERLGSAEARWPQRSLAVRTHTALLHEDGRSQEALQVVRDATGRMPENAALLQLLAAMELETGGREAALEVYRRALALVPDDPTLQNDLAYLLVEGGQPNEEALLLAQRAGEQEPGNAAFRDTLGWALRAGGELEQAIAELQLAVRLDPENDVITDHLAQAQAQAERRQEAATPETRYKAAPSTPGSP